MEILACHDVSTLRAGEFENAQVIVTDEDTHRKIGDIPRVANIIISDRTHHSPHHFVLRSMGAVVRKAISDGYERIVVIGNDTVYRDAVICYHATVRS